MEDKDIETLKAKLKDDGYMKQAVSDTADKISNIIVERNRKANLFERLFTVCIPDLVERISDYYYVMGIDIAAEINTACFKVNLWNLIETKSEEAVSLTILGQYNSQDMFFNVQFICNNRIFGWKSFVETESLLKFLTSEDVIQLAGKAVNDACKELDLQLSMRGVA